LQRGPDTQLVFTDTPGIFAPKRRLDRAMVTTAWGGARDGDIVLVLIDAARGIAKTRSAAGNAASMRQPKYLVLNKVDTVDPPKLLELRQATERRRRFRRDLHDLGAERLGLQGPAEEARRTLPEGPWYYPEDQISDLPMRQLAAEITREKLYLRLHQELPYPRTVETESWEEKKDGSVRRSSR
jgi:GTP-binding protein Era